MQERQVFCKLDIYKAYLHVELDEETKLMQTILTHLITFKVNRLLQGIKTEPNEFQRIVSKISSNLDGVVSYFNDIIIMEKDFQRVPQSLLTCLD